MCFSSEIDKFACETYEANFGEKPRGDITKIESSEIPIRDILVGGFPPAFPKPLSQTMKVWDILMVLKEGIMEGC